MAYTKKTWVSGETPLSAENMNNIENGIANAHEDISKLNTKINMNGEYIYHPVFSSQYVYSTARAYIPFCNADKYNITLVNAYTGDGFATDITSDIDVVTTSNEIGISSHSNHATMIGKMAYIKLNIVPKS